MTTRLFFRRRSPVGFGVFILLLGLLLEGCQSTQLKLSPQSALSLTALTVVAMEPPPLEVTPDLLETRMPVYRHFDNMALPAYSQPALYRLPGGILISGETGASDSVPQLQSSVKSSSDWIPTLDLAAQAEQILQNGGMSACIRPGVMPLQTGTEKRITSTGFWRDAATMWYEQDRPNIALTTREIEPILMLGITDFRIFANQTSLRLLMKIVDPVSGRVLAKTSQAAYSTEAQGQNSLANGGIAFKVLIGKLGARLIEQGLRDMGLFSSTALKSVSNDLGVVQNRTRYRDIPSPLLGRNTNADNG